MPDDKHPPKCVMDELLVKVRHLKEDLDEDLVTPGEVITYLDRLESWTWSVEKKTITRNPAKTVSLCFYYPRPVVKIVLVYHDRTHSHDPLATHTTVST